MAGNVKRPKRPAGNRRRFKPYVEPPEFDIEANLPKNWILCESVKIADNQWLAFIFEKRKRLFGLTSFMGNKYKRKRGALIVIREDSELLQQAIYRFAEGDYDAVFRKHGIAFEGTWDDWNTPHVSVSGGSGPLPSSILDR
jgi:hypothetical protein